MTPEEIEAAIERHLAEMAARCTEVGMPLRRGQVESAREQLRAQLVER